MLGHVKWFSDVKGYGFVVADEQPDTDIFVHYTEIQSEGFKSLVEGQPITFDIKDGPKGPFACNVCMHGEVLDTPVEA